MGVGGISSGSMVRRRYHLQEVVISGVRSGGGSARQPFLLAGFTKRGCAAGTEISEADNTGAGAFCARDVVNPVISVQKSRRWSSVDWSSDAKKEVITGMSRKV